MQQKLRNSRRKLTIIDALENGMLFSEHPFGHKLNAKTRQGSDVTASTLHKRTCKNYRVFIKVPFFMQRNFNAQYLLTNSSF